jgi:hypothetical protein
LPQSDQLAVVEGDVDDSVRNRALPLHFADPRVVDVERAAAHRVQEEHGATEGSLDDDAGVTVGDGGGVPEVIDTFWTAWISVRPPVPPVNPTRTDGGRLVA